MKWDMKQSKDTEKSKATFCVEYEYINIGVKRKQIH